MCSCAAKSMPSSLFFFLKFPFGFFSGFCAFLCFFCNESKHDGFGARARPSVQQLRLSQTLYDTACVIPSDS